MKASRQKSYADLKRKPLEFEEGNKVFLKVAPMKGIMRFGKKGKLSPRYVGPFEILERVGPVAYRLALPPEFSNVHVEDLPYVEEPLEILDRKDKVPRNRAIPLVKVLWRNHSSQEASWELESDMRAKFS
ncbi:uncharacterized protein LOC122651577 [Telopea speciosissima]|uniref:uncharacterized protein LOC122651577 n=1 Tax=Telopea speciosissima TaxID=54955 RepID=UPI001CC7F4FA|nr:uncharacterized protein LOC122651577 [Telopea speciosissima]